MQPLLTCADLFPAQPLHINFLGSWLQVKVQVLSTGIQQVVHTFIVYLQHATPAVVLDLHTLLSLRTQDLIGKLVSRSLHCSEACPSKCQQACKDCVIALDSIATSVLKAALPMSVCNVSIPCSSCEHSTFHNTRHLQQASGKTATSLLKGLFAICQMESVEA